VIALEYGSSAMARSDDATNDTCGQQIVVPDDLHHHAYQRVLVLLRVHVLVPAFGKLR
jgi:hypothetical protein